MASSTLTPLEPNEQELGAWLKSPGFRAPQGTMLHHTWSPTAAQYSGRDTIVGIRRYHMQSLGWSDIGANAYACPDGTVITGRPLSYANWCHGYIMRDDPEAELWAAAHQQRMWPNQSCFGLETVANFDKEKPQGTGAAAKSLECALDVLTVVHRLFHIPAEMLFFHRDAENKSCPGSKLGRAEVRQEIARRLQAIVESKVVLGSTVIPCEPTMLGEEMTVAAAPLLAALNVPLSQIPVGVIHENGRAYVGELAPYCVPAGWRFYLRQMAQGPRLYVKQEA